MINNISVLFDRIFSPEFRPYKNTKDSRIIRNKYKPHMMRHVAVFQLIIFSGALVMSAPRIHARQRLWCAYLRGQLIPLRASDTCVHGHVPTPCGALCKKGPGEMSLSPKMSSSTSILGGWRLLVETLWILLTTMNYCIAPRNMLVLMPSIEH